MKIVSNEFFTIYFIILPKDKYFTWHDHPEMNGFIKCLFGELKVSKITGSKLQEENGQHVYPKQFLNEEIIHPKNNSLSLIDPEEYNIHKVMGIQQSGFFDIMLPEYPSKTYQSFKTISETEDRIILELLPSTYAEEIYLLKNISF